MISHFPLFPPFSPVQFVSGGVNPRENGGLRSYDL